MGEWKKLKLKDVLIEGSKERVDDTSKYQKLTIKLNFKGIEKSKVREKMADRRPFYIRKKGEIVIGKQNYFNGSIAILPDELDGGICSNAIMSFNTKKGYSNKFIYYMLSNPSFINKRSYLANGTGQKELSEKDFLNFDIIIPEILEQEKIVSILEKNDKIIENLDFEISENEKLVRCLLNNVLKKYKTQKIKLKNIIAYRKGFAFKSKDYTEKGCRIIRVSDLDEKEIKDDCEKIFIDESKKKLYANYILKEDDLIVTTVGSKPPIYSSVAGRVIKVSKKYEGCLLNQNTIRLRVNKRVRPLFLFSQLNTRRYYNYLNIIMRGNANQGNITVEELLNYEIEILDENIQNKIEKILRLCIEKNKYLGEKKDNYIKLRRKLMDELLTGKIKVKL